MRLFNFFHNVDWKQRKLLLQQLEQVWTSNAYYRFGELMSNIFESYWKRGFGMKQVRYMEELSDMEWLDILGFISKDPNWTNGPNTGLITELDPARISEMINALEGYWRQAPRKRLGEIIMDLSDQNKQPIYQVSDRSLREWLTISEKKQVVG